MRHCSTCGKRCPATRQVGWNGAEGPKSPRLLAAARRVATASDQARLFACTILRHGLASLLSGIRNWISFAEVALGGAQFAFPPSLEGIIAWSHAFRCVGTYANYVGYLRSACLALDLDVPPANHLAIQRAKIAIVKRMLFTPRCGL